jgi:hypothetical protein
VYDILSVHTRIELRVIEDQGSVMPLPARHENIAQLLVCDSLAGENLDRGLQQSLNHLKDLRVAQLEVPLRPLE